MKLFCLIFFIFAIPFTRSFALEEQFYDAPNILTSKIDRTLVEAEKALMESRFDCASDLYDHAEYLCNELEGSKFQWLTILFGKVIVLGCIAFEGISDEELSQISAALTKIACNTCDNTFYPQGLQVGRVVIGGPDSMTKQECESTVTKTKELAIVFIAALPIPIPTKTATTCAIIAVSEAAINCCWQGGIWKSCIAPLVDKFNTLKERIKIWQQAGGQLPDPLWD